jgi:hypothetical protein
LPPPPGLPLVAAGEFGAGLLGQAASDEAARKRRLTVTVRADIASTMLLVLLVAGRRHGYATATKATETDERL